MTCTVGQNSSFSTCIAESDEKFPWGKLQLNQQNLDKCSYAGRNKPAWLAQNQSLPIQHRLVKYQAKPEWVYGTRSPVKEQMCHYSWLFPQELRVTCGTNRSIVLAQSWSWMHSYSLVVSSLLLAETHWCWTSMALPVLVMRFPPCPQRLGDRSWLLQRCGIEGFCLF